MLFMLEVVSARGANLLLPISEVSDGIFVKEIEGLDPVKANIVSSSFANLDGSQYHTSRRESRNLVIHLGMEVNTTPVKSIRKRLYEFFMTKSAVTLRFHSTDMPMVEIQGRVESCEAPPFTSDPGMTVSVMCFNPDFYNPEVNTFAISSTATTTEMVLEYAGSVDTGMIIRSTIPRAITNFTIDKRSTDGIVYSMDFVGSLVAGDLLEISTVAGAKGATLTRASTISSVLYGISPYSAWLNLAPGTNSLRIYAVGTAIPFTIEYTDKYGGL